MNCRQKHLVKLYSRFHNGGSEGFSENDRKLGIVTFLKSGLCGKI